MSSLTQRFTDREAGAVSARVDRRSFLVRSAYAFPGYGPAHGFSVDISVAPGRHEVCTFGNNVGAGTRNTGFGCKTATA